MTYKGCDYFTCAMHSGLMMETSSTHYISLTTKYIMYERYEMSKGNKKRDINLHSFLIHSKRKGNDRAHADEDNFQKPPSCVLDTSVLTHLINLELTNTFCCCW